MELFQKSLSTRIRFGRELTGILAVVTAFMIFPYLIREADPSAAAIDPGILSAFILAIAALLVFKAVTWWVLKGIWPVFASYSERQFTADFQKLAPMHKVLVYLGFYLLVLYALIRILETLL